MEQARLRAGDLAALVLPPGPAWPGILSIAREAGAALLPLDPRLPAAAARDLIERARPTVVIDDEGALRRRERPVEDDLAFVIHTSGTAGAPRMACFTRVAADAAVHASTRALGASSGDRWIACLPLAHVGGLLVVQRGVALGAPVSVLPTFDVAAFEAEREAVFTSLVPTQLLRLLDAGADLSRFRSILVGGSGLPPDLRRRAEDAGARVVETYGQTESFGGVVYDGSPLPGTQVRIGDAQEIELRGPTTMRGYRLDPEASAGTLGPDGWLRTGDAGRLGPGGKLEVVGRLDDLIVSGGEKVWPEQVEAALAGHARVEAVAVGPRPDPEWGQRVVAWVVPRERSTAPTLDDLREHAARTLPRSHAPRELVIVDRLPRTYNGKVRRQALDPR